jgi:hypothetical protein
MNLKIWTGIVVLTVIILTGLLLIKTETPFVIMSVPEIHSIYQSSPNETHRITILSNQANRYEFNQDYITSAAIVNDEDTALLKIVDVHIFEEEKRIESMYYTPISFEFELAFSLTNSIIQYQDAALELTYENNQVLSIYIGEFNYVFEHTNPSDLSLSALKATSQTIANHSTIGGVYIELANRTNSPIIITQVEAVSPTVSLNQASAIRRYEPVDYKDQVTDIIEQSSYDFFNPVKETTLSFMLRETDNIALYIPLLYLGDITHIERFALCIHYTIDNEEHIFYVDDFPYVRTDLFDETYQEDWVIIDGTQTS